VRQPEVARLTTLVVAALLIAPAARAAWRLLVTGAFLIELLSAGALRPLSALTSEPVRKPLAVPDARVDRYAPHALVAGTPLVLVHGLAPAGKDDPRVVDASTLLARAGFDVAVPTIPGLTRGRLRPGDAAPVVATLATRSVPSVVLAVSVGAGPALLAAADAAVRDRVRAVLCLGGYASAVDVMRFYLTGDFEYGGIRGHVTHDPEAVRAFIDANGELIDSATRAALDAGDRERVDALLDTPPPGLRAMLDALSPERVVPHVHAPLLLVHGLDDPAVPYTESLRLAAARPSGTTVVIVGLLSHVEGTPRVEAPWHTVRDFARLLSIMYGLAAG
jgi:fermentation-respiration switch protein FrsA (DUF1100 family)